MKTIVIAAVALSAATATAPLSAAGLSIDLEALTLAQQAQVFSVINSDENQATKKRLLKAIEGSANATEDDVIAARFRFIDESGENSATRKLLKAIVGKANATEDDVIAAKFRFIDESDENSATRKLLIDAARE